MENRPARAEAVRRQDQEIADSAARAIAAREANSGQGSALANMANRLGVSQGLLKSTLMSTVFKGASEAEFAALIVVAEAYGLNPLTKEIYAFPAKGGIAPMVSIDGWVNLCNRHPQFDGFEFEDVAGPDGKLMGIYCQIHRKDRSRPTRIIEYLVECKRETDPWKKSPARMLRHRALMQCARYAFGFSGIAAEGDDPDEYVLTPQGMRDVTPAITAAMPKRSDFTGSVDTVDAVTGEVLSTGDEERDRLLREPADDDDDGGENAANESRSPDSSSSDKGDSTEQVSQSAKSGEAVESARVEPEDDGTMAMLRQAVANSDSEAKLKNVERALPSTLTQVERADIMGLIGTRRSELKAKA